MSIINKSALDYLKEQNIEFVRGELPINNELRAKVKIYYRNFLSFAYWKIFTPFKLYLSGK